LHRKDIGSPVFALLHQSCKTLIRLSCCLSYETMTEAMKTFTCRWHNKVIARVKMHRVWGKVETEIHSRTVWNWTRFGCSNSIKTVGPQAGRSRHTVTVIETACMPKIEHCPQPTPSITPPVPVMVGVSTTCVTASGLTCRLSVKWPTNIMTCSWSIDGRRLAD